jgi:hypothetical protein
MLLAGGPSHNAINLGKQALWGLPLGQKGVYKWPGARRRIEVIGEHEDRGERVQFPEVTSGPRVLVFKRLVDHDRVDLAIGKRDQGFFGSGKREDAMTCCF